MIAKHKCKVKEDKTKNVNNWNEHFDKLKKKKNSEKQDSNEIDTLLKYAKKKTTTNENCQIHRNYQKTTVAITTDHATTIHEDLKFIKCTTHSRWNR